MSRFVAAALVGLVGLAACSSDDPEPEAAPQPSESLPLSPPNSMGPSPMGPSPMAPSPMAPSPMGPNPSAQASAPEPGGGANFTTFVDAETGWSTQDVRDVDRQIVRFDAGRTAMVWASTGDAVGGWATDGNELRWSRGGAFRVRFGSEAGERRAYFTEAGPGTICDLEITAPEQLSISPSSEVPPSL